MTKSMHDEERQSSHSLLADSVISVLVSDNVHYRKFKFEIRAMLVVKERSEV